MRMCPFISRLSLLPSTLALSSRLNAPPAKMVLVLLARLVFAQGDLGIITLPLGCQLLDCIVELQLFSFLLKTFDCTFATLTVPRIPMFSG